MAYMVEMLASLNAAILFVLIGGGLVGVRERCAHK